MPLTAEQRQEVESLFTSVVQATFRRLRASKIDTRPINPFLVLVTRTPEDLAEFLVWQRLERGFVTSLGMRFQKVADIISPTMHPSGVAGADSEGRDESAKRHYLMQVKSGPDTIDKDISERIQTKLQSAENRIKSLGQASGWAIVKVLGMCYGQPKHRSGWVLELGKRGFDVDKIGREFWAFITGEPDAYREVFQIAVNVATTYKNGHGKTLATVIDESIEQLTNQITERYGDGTGGIDWPRLLEDNM